MRHRAVYWGLVFTMMVVVSLFSIKPTTQVSAQNDKTPEDPSMREVYDNPELFAQLSSAAQIRLERKFGKQKPALTKESSSRRIPSFAQGRLSILSALTQPLVNNPSADLSDQDTQSETTIVLGSGMNVVGSFNDSGSFTGINSHFTGYSTSSDMGSTWTDRGILPDSTFGDAGDPVLARSNSTGTIFLSTLGFDSDDVLQIFRSTDNGVTWGTPVNGAPGAGGAADAHDKEWIAVDNFAGSGQGNVYMAWRDFGTGGGMLFTRSTDDGLTWSPNNGLSINAGSGQGAFVAVGPDHSVYYFWFHSATAPDELRMRRSTDQGVTFGAPVTVTTLLSTGVNGDLGLEFRSSTFPHAAVNPANGHVYIVYDDNPAGADRGDVFFRSSTDMGATWSAATRVNNDAGTNDNWSPTIGVTPDGSAFSITWYDRRSDPANVLIQRWGVAATVSGGVNTFGPNFRISDSFGVAVGQDPVINTTYMGDYDHMAADNSFFYHIWGDNRLSDAFFAQQPDVRFAKVPLGGPGPILDLAPAPFATVTGGNGNGAIDFNECNDLAIKVMNNGSATATGVTGTLSTSTPNVSVSTPNASYPDIPAGGMASNTTPFQISTAPGFACGTSIQLTLTLNYTGGSDVVNLTLLTGSLGAPLRFDNNTVTPIFDAGPPVVPATQITDIPITVAGFTGVIGDVNVSFHLTHTFDADLDISLISPGGLVSIDLTSDNGGASDNYGTSCSPDGSRTTFDDSAGTDITAGAAPFVGTFRPEQALAAFNGLTAAQVNGTWTLRINDDFTTDSGTFMCVSLFLAPLTCTDGGGQCDGEGCVLDITCPADTIGVTTTGASSGTVTYCPPIVGGTCSMPNVVCTPPSGSSFPLGTTTVTCTASAAGAEDVSCSFTVTLFNACLEQGSTVLIFNTATGDYIFCCPNTSPNPVTGKGVVKKIGSTFTLTSNIITPPAHRVRASITGGSVNKGNASLQNSQGITVCTINDPNTLDNSCACAGLGGDCGGGDKSQTKK